MRKEGLSNGELTFGENTDFIVLHLLTSVYAIESFLCGCSHR